MNARRSNPRRKIGAWLAALCAATTCVAGAQQADYPAFILPGEETFSLDAGSIVSRYDSSVRLDGTVLRGTNFSLEGNNLSRTRANFFASSMWRFLPDHRVSADYFETRRSGTKGYQTSITIGDNDYPLGAAVSAEARSRFLLVDYQYSFVKTSNVELAGVLGLYGGQVKFNLTATGNASSASVTSSTTASTTVPLPLVGASVDWYPVSRWKVGARLEGLKARLGDIDGHAIVAAASTDYMIVRNVGVGARYMYTDLEANVSKTGFHGNFAYRTNSISVYGRLLF